VEEQSAQMKYLGEQPSNHNIDLLLENRHPSVNHDDAAKRLSSYAVQDR
jgi:hypothetical protein